MNMKNPSVVYSIGVRFAGVGTGYTAYNAVRWGPYKFNSLRRLICLSYNKTEIPDNKIVSFSWMKYFIFPFRAAQMLFGWDWICPFRYSDRLYAHLASKRIIKSDIFHGWMGYSMKSMEIAKKQGAITILECASSHPRSQKKLLMEEYEKYPSNSKTADELDLIKMEKELARADYVLIPSDFVEQSFIDQGFPEKKIIKIPFGVDLKKFTTKKEKKDNKFRAIFVGSIQLRKGIQYLLQAWDELNLKNAELIIVGRVYPDIQRVIDKYKKNKSIKFVGFADPRKYYAQADIAVFPSIEEGSALVNYEAMASGLPLITTFNSGTIARDGKEALIVPIRNIKILKEKIKYMYSNPDKAKKMGKAARKLVEENYTWEKYGERLINAYRNIVMEKHGTKFKKI